MAVSLERLARNQVLFREVNERLREMRLDHLADLTDSNASAAIQSARRLSRFGLPSTSACARSPISS
jgi:hypothetical protein